MMIRYTLLFCILTSVCLCNEKDQKYSRGDKFYAWTNREYIVKIGPYHNPHETYDYFSLPFCRPTLQDGLKSKKGGLSEVLEGTTLENSGIEFSFLKNTDSVPLCEMVLNNEQSLIMQSAIFNHYWYQLEIDGLPIWSKVGDLDLSASEISEMEKKGSHHEVIAGKSRLYTHRHFSIGYNGDRIVEVNMTSSNPQIVLANSPLRLTTSVTFVPSVIAFNLRFNRYLEYNFFESRIHWYSIFNSFMIVVFLAGLVALIMIRTLSMDYLRYAQVLSDETLEMTVKDETGWKRIHGDVFRACHHLSLFCILMGNGSHVVFTLITSLLVIVLATSYVGRILLDIVSLSDDRVLTIALIVYVVGFFVNGFVSGSIYKQAFFPRTSPNWQRSMIISASFVPIIISVVYSILCFMSITQGALSFFPLWNIVSLGLIWVVACLPLHTVGTILGRSLRGNPNNPCRVASLPSPIPPTSFYAQPKFIILVSGLLPFGSIFIEIFFIFASIWSYKYYYVYGFLASMILILVIIQVCVSIVGTYVLLNSENYNWRWTSFLSGASIGIYIFLYCIYFYFYKTEMDGILQASYFFAESILLVGAISLFCGYMSSKASEVFVKRIFKNIKVD